jgi:hypothetical protein
MFIKSFSPRLVLYIALLLNLVNAASCKQASSAERDSRKNIDANAFQHQVFSDGSYCATVQYTNGLNGNSFEDVLPVEVEKDELLKINWADANDAAHFEPVTIRDSMATFISAKGINFKIKIIGQGDCSSFAGSAKFQKDQICPVCGHWKNASDELCTACNDEIANTCYKCGRYALGVNGGLCDECRSRICPICSGKKYPLDDLCADCHNLIEEETSDKITKNKK